MNHLFNAELPKYQNVHSFQMRSKMETMWNNLNNKPKQILNDIHQPETTSLLKTAYSMISAVINKVAPLVVILFYEFSLKKRRSQHAKQQKDLEEGFSSLIRVEVNVLFITSAVLTVHRSIQKTVIQMGSAST